MNYQYNKKQGYGFKLENQIMKEEKNRVKKKRRKRRKGKKVGKLTFGGFNLDISILPAWVKIFGIVGLLIPYIT